MSTRAHLSPAAADASAPATGFPVRATAPLAPPPLNARRAPVVIIVDAADADADTDSPALSAA
jgi:hypothetical protein